MWLNNERKYARKSLRTRSKTTAIEKEKEAYLEIFANRKMGKTYFSLTTKEGVNNYLEHRKKDVESGFDCKEQIHNNKNTSAAFPGLYWQRHKAKGVGTY